MAFRNELGTFSLREVVDYAKRSGFLGCKPGTVEEVLNEYLGSKRHTRKMNLAYRNDVGCLLAFLRKKGREGCPIFSVTRAELEEWLGEELKLGLAWKTVKDRRTSFITVSKFARKRGYLPPNRMTEAELVLPIQPPDSRKLPPVVPIFMPEQYQAVIDWYWGRRADLRRRQQLLYFVLGGKTGARSSELVQLCVGDIDLAGGWLTIPAHVAKTGVARSVPVGPDLYLFLEALLPRGANLDMRLFYPSIAARVHAVGKRLLGSWPFNGLRHSYGTYMYQRSGVSLGDVTKWMGNSEAIFLKRYHGSVRTTADIARYWAICPPGTEQRLADMVKTRETAKRAVEEAGNYKSEIAAATS